jgi:UDP-N-acetylmuramyl tripeptide synthase
VGDAGLFKRLAPRLEAEPGVKTFGAALRVQKHFGIATLPRDVAISDLTQDSRGAQPGGAFLAVHGSAEHGLKYAPQAVANGARAVLWEPAPVAVVPDLPSEILVAPVPGLREHASLLADRFFGAPSSRLAVAGITGTNVGDLAVYLRRPPA